MPRKQAMGDFPKSPSTTPGSPTADEQRSGGASKSGQYPGEGGQPEIGKGHEGAVEPSGTSRGTDPALQGHYVRSGRAQGPTPGKTQVHNPNEPVKPATMAAGGQFPGIPVGSKAGKGQDDETGVDIQGGAMKTSQPRESSVGSAAGGQYPGVPLGWKALFPGGSDPVRSISKDEGDDLNLKKVGTTGDVGARNVISETEGV
jgi:hypothetical protein